MPAVWAGSGQGPSYNYEQLNGIVQHLLAKLPSLEVFEYV
jgi:hypothetical protein